jgi:hypothetical protein
MMRTMAKLGRFWLVLGLGICALLPTTLAEMARAMPLVDAGPTGLLPDLDAAAFQDVETKVVDGRVYLTFQSLTTNIGSGPLIVHGQRATAEGPMTADQLIRLADGTTTTVPSVGSLVYDSALERWGFAPYLRYELRRAIDGRLSRAADERDLCIEDRLNDAATTFPGEPVTPVYRECGRRRPNLLTLDVGLSVGWGNRHLGSRSGQRIDITGLGTRRYLLVLTVNGAGTIHEASIDNNTSSVLLQLKRKKGQLEPKIRVLEVCPDTATCSVER